MGRRLRNNFGRARYMPIISTCKKCGEKYNKMAEYGKLCDDCFQKAREKGYKKKKPMQGIKIHSLNKKEKRKLMAILLS